VPKSRSKPVSTRPATRGSAISLIILFQTEKASLGLHAR
jgi:hypothetical protein